MPLLLNGIVMWSGTSNEIPTGWSLCDGTNGTPNLQNIFVVGAGSTYNFADTGGSANTIVALHNHSISGTTGGSGTVAHSHPLNTSARQTGTFAAAYATGTGANQQLGQSGGNHAHGVVLEQVGVGETGIGKNLPPYYALAFIMQTS